jgi:hypothetical protein
MRIILHILVKDLRRQWIELGLFVLTCAAWVWETTHPGEWDWFRQRELVPVLLFGLWFFIVIRSVQGECLVGDREFWMTRPYRWPQLMAAKALFFVLCLNTPLFMAQLVLLSAAKIPLSWALVPGLCFLGVLFAFFFTFPVAALASITQSLVQWGLTVAVGLVYALTLSWLPWNKLPDALEGGENFCGSLGMATIAPALAYILLWQYARRRVWPPRLVFAGILLLVPLIALLSTAPFIRSITYPQTTSSPPLRLSIAESSDNPTRTYTRYYMGNDAQISIPVSTATADSDTLVKVDGLRVTLTAENGWRWQSLWQNRSVEFSRSSPNGTLTFNMPEDKANQMAKLHAKASAELAFSVYRLGAPHRVDTQADRFQLLGNTYCHWRNPEIPFFSGEVLDCEAALHLPVIMEIEIESGSSTCSRDPAWPPLPAGHYASNVQYGTDLPADFDPDPAHRLNLNFGFWIPAIPSPDDPKISLRGQSCRGTPLSVRTGVSENQMRASYDLGFIGSEVKPKPGTNFRFGPDSE